MGFFKDQIPPDLLDYPMVDQYTTVLDYTLAYKDDFIDSYTRAFNPLKLTNVAYLQKYVGELGNIPLVPGIPKKILENIILNAANIYILKTSNRGFELFLKSVTDGDVFIDASKLYAYPNYIILSDFSNGFLPAQDGSTLENAYLNYYDGQNQRFLYLFGGDVQAAIESSVNIAIKSKYSNVKEFRDWVVSLIPMFLPFTNDNTQINVSFYGFEMLSNINLNNYLYVSHT